MGIDLTLMQDGKAVQVEPFQYGSVYALGGTSEADIAITYNYSRVYNEIVPDWPGMIRFFNGKRAGDMIPTMRMIVERLGTERDPDYWAPTPGNAGYVMNMLLGWAEQYPDAVWDCEG